MRCLGSPNTCQRHVPTSTCYRESVSVVRYCYKLTVTSLLSVTIKPLGFISNFSMVNFGKCLKIESGLCDPPGSLGHLHMCRRNHKTFSRGARWCLGVVTSRTHAASFPAGHCGRPAGFTRTYRHDVTAPRAPASARVTR